MWILYLGFIALLIGLSGWIILSNTNAKAEILENGSANLRTGPGLTYHIDSQLDQGASYHIISKSNDWLYILTDSGKTGWIPQWSNTKALAAAKSKDETSGFIVTLLSNSNVYQEDSTKSKSLGSLHQGDKFNAFYQKGNWVQIQYGNQVGWVLQENLELTPGHVEEEGIQQPTAEENMKINSFLTNYHYSVVSNAAGANIRVAADTSSEIVDTVKKNERMAYLGLEGAYYHVRTVNNKEGYIANWLASSNSEEMQNLAKQKKSTSTLANKTIVLDPGHGGEDSGALSSKGDKEKDSTLKTAEAVKVALENAGAKVIMTRENDTFVDLAPRAKLSNDQHADAFISIHYDKYEDDIISGTTTYYYNDQSKPLAEMIQSFLLEENELPSQGIRYGNLQVLRDNHSPSVLLELGYMSNPKDVKAFTSKKYQDNIGKLVTDALTVYFQK